MQKEFKDRKHRIKIVILKDHSVYRMENRLEGGRSVVGGQRGVTVVI